MPDFAQAAFCRLRHQPSRPPPAKTRPGRPAPAIGPGTVKLMPLVVSVTVTEVGINVPQGPVPSGGRGGRGGHIPKKKVPPNEPTGKLKFTDEPPGPPGTIATT